MKRFYARFSVSLTTFAFGLASVFFTNGSFRLEIPVSLSQTETGGIQVVFPGYSSEIPRGGGSGSHGEKKNGLAEETDASTIRRRFPRFVETDFVVVGHVPGEDYVRHWLVQDKFFLSEGFVDAGKSDLTKEANDADEIIEWIDNFKNKHGKRGLRIILKSRDIEIGEDVYQVIWFPNDGGKRRIKHYIAGPNLTAVIELEKFLNSREKH
ncbi:MAG: hypothetical protein KDB79_16820 [Acidobacteria bacterium]|nr:hypothetical protein [Acidobacteriota bacterium]